ncbi:ankyrin repeat domain-containing protein [Spiroplasma endosymbiont of Tiphia femorata]|uniref:ankyrin repeat domain-containing protein n=1 Tax=Spiroplasma endosymbiont of Tiphia femorata TaxID=3066326 RepID=UPI0030CF28C8
MFLEELENIIVNNYDINISYKCANFLIMNDEKEQLVKLFKVNNSILFKSKLSFALAKKLIEEGNIKGIKLLTNIISLEEIIDNETNLFHIAANNGQIDILKYLLSINKELINNKNKKGKTPIECAFEYAAKRFIKYGEFDNEVIEFLINNSNVNLLFTNNEIWKSLDPNSNINSVKGWNIFHIAILFGNVDIVKLLIQKLNDQSLINYVAEKIGTPLQCAIVGASVDTTGLPKEGMPWVNPLSYFRFISNNDMGIKDSRTKILVENYKEIAKTLLSILSYDQINSKDTEGDSPIHDCVLRSNVELLKLVLNAGGEVNMQNNLGYTPLHQAVLYSRFEVIEELLQIPNIDLTIKDKSGLTAYDLIVKKSNRKDKIKIINLIENCLLSKNIKFERFVEVIIDNNISDNNISDNNISDTNGYYDEVDTVSLLSNDDDTSDVDSIIWESNNNFSDSLVTDTVSYTTRF